jgi:hypothetical protein
MQESLVLILWELILQVEHSESEVPKHVSQEKWHSISIQTELTPLFDFLIIKNNFS